MSTEIAVDNRITTSRIPWKTLVICLMILLCGAVIGSAATLQFLNVHARRVVAEPERMPERIATHLDRYLRLDDEQKAEVRAIFEDRAAAMRGIGQQVRPQVDEANASMKARMAAVLTPDQRARWEARYETFGNLWRVVPPAP